MKKLMIAFAVAAMAAGLQAATINWSLGKSTLKDKNGDVMTGASVYVIDTLSAGYDATTVLAALTSGDLNAGNIGDQSYFIETKTTSTSTKTPGSIADHKANSGNLADQQNVALAYVVFDTQEGVDYFFVSSGASGKAYIDGVSEGSPASFSGSHFSSGSGWTAVSSGDVPEPTSAMLLLLGMAGLALRRRRA